MKNSKKKQKEKWPLDKTVEVFLLAFGVLTIAVPMAVAMASDTAVFTGAQAKGILIAGFGIVEAGAILGTVRRRREGKDIAFSIGICGGLLIVLILQLLG